jgi:iron complex transport system substrate-binding protein
MTKLDADAYDYYEMAVIRPDLVLGDLVRMLHPALRDQPFLYIRPDTQVVR